MAGKALVLARGAGKPVVAVCAAGLPHTEVATSTPTSTWRMRGDLRMGFNTLQWGLGMVV